MASVQVQRSETHDEAICRLADTAMERGVRIYRTPDGRHWATSISRPGDLYFVTGVSCTCQGFMHWQRCTHHSALLASLGWLPASPDPTTPAPRVAEVPCHNCAGYGWFYAEDVTGRIDRVTCWTCDGRGVEPATLIAA